MVLWGFEPQSLDYKTERRTTRPQNLMRVVICRMCCSRNFLGSIRILPSEKHVTLECLTLKRFDTGISVQHWHTQFRSCYMRSELPCEKSLH